MAVLDGAELGGDSFAGPATRRHHHPLSATRALDGLATHPVVSSVLDHCLGPARQFGMTVVTSIESAQPPQGLHYDAGIYPLGDLNREVMVNTIWALDDFTIANGATRVVPGSHRWPARRPSTGEAVAIEMSPGSVLIYSGKLWHGSGEHHGQGRRLGVILEYIDARLSAGREPHPLRATGAGGDLARVPGSRAGSRPEELDPLPSSIGQESRGVGIDGGAP